ncbi:MAG TPA: PqqD family protein [Anaerolineae bacterium]|nr:PqqD family protein [Anaerolineae bacterium]
MELTLNSYPAPAEHVRGRRLEYEAVVVLPDQGQVKVLNEVGAQIWALVDGSRSVREIAVAVCREYDVPSAVAEADTLKFLTELQQKGLIIIQA